ncbi:hypothetical protein [Pantoea agglomerans]|uniref:hypothetical protein n=2 Tax=Enterobacter agglomerans TaxID=549 RepID=UPI001F4E0556|nr:hypothetical protein [Pantoea agglomerans]MCH9405310.1 hypothetical protein [Pantoea agglomerans]WNK29587.1 hypothetical protein RM157_13605 [Pantoea agglomerans]WNK61461.1 hypothetical protein RM152_13375 [Pantoea agglomerans]
MKTFFFFDEETFLSDNFLSEYNHSCHSSLIESWRDYGALVIPKNKSVEKYYEAINSVHPKFRKKWQEAFVRFHLKKSEIDIYNLSTYRSIDELAELACEVSTFLMPNELSENISFDDEGICLHSSKKFEVVESSSILSSVFFKKSKHLSRQSISNAENGEEIWKWRIENLCEMEKNIVITDRYLIENIKRDVTSTNKSNNILYNLTKFISSSGNIHSLKIFSSGGESGGENHIFIENYLHTYLSKTPFFSKALSLLEIYSIDETIFKNDGHDRYIRFGNYVCEIGLGMEVFRSQNNRATTFSIKDISNTYNKELERDMIKKRKWTYTYNQD